MAGALAGRPIRHLIDVVQLFVRVQPGAVVHLLLEGQGGNDVLHRVPTCRPAQQRHASGAQLGMILLRGEAVGHGNPGGGEERGDRVQRLRQQRRQVEEHRIQRWQGAFEVLGRLKSDPLRHDVGARFLGLPPSLHQRPADEAEARRLRRGPEPAHGRLHPPGQLAIFPAHHLADGMALIQRGFHSDQARHLSGAVEARLADALRRMQAVAAFPGAQALRRDAGALGHRANLVQVLCHSAILS